MGLVASLALAAAQSQPDQTPAFEVATVKPNTSAAPPSSTFFQRSSQFVISNHPLRLLMAVAFNLDVNKAAALITGLPRWADTDGFDIQAAMPAAASNSQKRLMLQALLADRFKLTIHRETRQLPVFALVMSNPGRLGPQLRRHTDEQACQPADPAPTAPAQRPARTLAEAAALALLDVPCGRITSGLLQDQRTQAWAGGRRVTLQVIAERLGELTPLERPVVLDQTGLEGTFDFTMWWNPQIQELAPSAADATGLSFLQAFREHVGLRLQPQAGPVEVIVVDRVERPTPD